MKKDKTYQKIILVIILFFIELMTVKAQDTLYVFPSRAEVNVLIENKISLEANNLNYQYSVTVKDNSEQKLEEFFIEYFSPIQSITSPTGWLGLLSSENIPVVMWGADEEQFDISKGEYLNGFHMVSEGLPGIVQFYARGYVEVPTFQEGEEPPTEHLIGDNIFENSVKGKTIGPKAISENTTNTELADTLSSYVTQSCDLGWIENQGICRSLQANLDNVKRQLEQGNTQTAANNLQAFLNEVEAIKDEHLSSEAYALLRFNGEYLLKKLREE